MSRSARDPEIVRVSQQGQATIPKTLREKFGIDIPGEVFIYEEDERIIVEPIPSLEELGGIHADTDREHDEVLDRVRNLKQEEQQREETRADRLRPTDPEDE